MEELPILLLLLILSGFFSGAEIAFFSLSTSKLHAYKENSKNEKENKRIEYIEKIKSDPNKLLVTILLGNNIVNIAASSMATMFALKMAAKIGMEENTSLVLGMVTGIMTLLILIFGEITPKSIAHKYALKFSLFSAPILKFLQVLLFPIIYPIALLTKAFSGSDDILHGLSEDELKAAVQLSAKEGQIDVEERELVEKVLEFNEHTVESIMTPRSKIFGFHDNTPVKEAMIQIAEEKYSRIPVFHETLDDIIGILKVQNILAEILKKDFETKRVANLSLLSPEKIPRTMKIDTLLRRLQETQNHMALVYDEHGGLIGLITLEDILEEIFGEFEDETDETVSHIRRTGKSTFICSGEIELEHIEEFLKENLEDDAPNKMPWSKEIENNSLGYFFLEKLERFPVESETLTIAIEEKIFHFEIKKVDHEKIEEVAITIKPLD
jgi:CBS domain containing-hemolysin-like protein